MDTEGEPNQELAAIEMHIETCEIKDVFRNFAYCRESDTRVRLHVHGLNVIYLPKHGYPTKDNFIIAFKHWLQRKPVVKIVTNAAYKEAHVLSLRVYNAGLSPWADRQFESLHILAVKYKQFMLPAKDNYRCSHDAHLSSCGNF